VASRQLEASSEVRKPQVDVKVGLKQRLVSAITDLDLTGRGTERPSPAGAVVHTCNPSYAGGAQSQASPGKTGDPI
jgi:hypothetical protein